MIHIITHSVVFCGYYSFLWFKHFDTQFSQPTNQNSMKVPKVVKATNKKNVILKHWGLV